ncbi:MAG: hypothetical protein MK066_06330 [Crocinitomicaceae bacterium]|nr:hypothetical protein [Crocinitomicaceae bacterium]
MKNIGIILGLTLTIFACENAPDQPTKSTIDESTSQQQEETKKESVKELISVKNGRYIEYHPGGKQVKFEGMQDDQGERHGTWTYYNEQGKQISSTEFYHGIKHGLSIVKYPNGVIHYTGNYKDGEQVGIWTTYDQQGNRLSSKNYDQIAN